MLHRNAYGQGDPYHTHLWFAFYRKSQKKKQMDAQLFFIIEAEGLRYGFYVGQYASDVLSAFRERVKSHAKEVWNTIREAGIDRSCRFLYAAEGSYVAKTPEEVKDAWDFWVWFEGQAKGFIERIPHVQGCGWAAYKADAARFTHKAYLRLSSDDNITEVLRPFGYISKIGNLALKVTGDLEPDAEELGDEELGEALEGAMRPRIDPQADPVSQILQAMGLA